MSIKLGNTGIGKMFLGSTEISKAYLGSSLIYQNVVKELVPVPTGFNWTPPFNIYKRGSNYSSDFNPDDFDFSDTATVTYYFNNDTGLNGNDGLTPLTPKKDISLVITDLNASIPANGAVFILQTDYTDIYSGSTLSTNFSLVLKSDTPGVKRLFSKVVTDGTTTTISAPVYRHFRNQVIGFIDNTNVDIFGKPIRPQVVSSSAECLATPNSFWQESATQIQFHLWDSRAPDSDVLFTRSGPTFYSTTTTARNFFFKDIIFWGNISNSLGTVDFNINGNPAHIICMDNCESGYSEYPFKVWTGNNVTSNPCRVYLNNCDFYHGAKDGANYHNTSGGGDADFPPNVFEQNSRFRHNGYTLISGGGTPNNNGSTMHDGGKIVSINCEMTYNQNRNIHDVGNGSQRWLIKTVAGYAQNQINEDDSIDFNFGDNVGTGDVQAWMEDCSFVGNSLKNLRVNAAATVRYKNMDLTGWDNQINGILETY